MGETRAGLVVAGLRKEYPAPGAPLLVLDGVDLRLEPGGSLTVSGPSGSGKSTLLNLLGALDRPTAGRISLAGVDPADLDDTGLAAWRCERVGFVFQNHHLLPQCTALENVLLGALAAGPITQTGRERARDLLERLGLGERVGHLPGELSGGQQQRVALARALINQPRLLLADEPTGNLDRAAGAVIGELLQELVTSDGAMLVVATHDPELADRFDRRATLIDGRLREGDHA